MNLITLPRRAIVLAALAVLLGCAEESSMGPAAGKTAQSYFPAGTLVEVVAPDSLGFTAYPEGGGEYAESVCLYAPAITPETLAGVYVKTCTGNFDWGEETTECHPVADSTWVNVSRTPPAEELVTYTDFDAAFAWRDFPPKYGVGDGFIRFTQYWWAWSDGFGNVYHGSHFHGIVLAVGVLTYSPIRPEMGPCFSD